ncbi:MFS transporter [Bradyrhizobium sp. CER78]|uniref:AmpG family muropeptide MFS transporter n=1 Tax=Bradyrhizobium sp. CER78 TaxID=3039162 RepID=UPI00244B1004|nr:MFS transporter [Bradyrhizobium sp. CER78]MDH2387060.1 MFS transporter [Bradyrhizobium sp. CER78]
MTAPEVTATPPQKAASWRELVAVYFQRRVLVVMLLGFSAGLPFSLAGQTLQAWMTESGVNIKTIGLFAFVGTPYWAKVFWSPAIDALDVPVLSRLLGRRRAWLILTQLWLMGAIILLACCDPFKAPALVAIAALLVTTASATQDIVIDAFRVESLGKSEQAAGMASYVAAYRVAALVSGAGSLLLVSAFVNAGVDQQHAYSATFVVMGLLIAVGIAATLLAIEPEQSAEVSAEHAGTGEVAGRRVIEVAIASLKDFLSRDAAIAVLLFVTLFKLADALATAMNTTFALKMGFSRVELAAILKGVGFAAALAGGFVGGFVCRSFSLSKSLWIGGILQTIAILAFSWQALVGYDVAWLTFAITAEQFTAGLGTVTFVAYLSALCGNPLHTATQYALLTALAALGRTVFAAGSGYIADATGWFVYFLVCTASAIPSFILLAWLQRRGHFDELGPVRV